MKFKIGTLRVCSQNRAVWVTVSHENGRLSITGTHGRGHAGQIIISFREYDGRGIYSIRDIRPAPGYTPEVIKELFDLWDRWHLNDMRPGCAHQMAEGWHKKRIDETKPASDYGRHFEGQTFPTWNRAGWVRPEEWPGGLLGKPCPKCQVKYGHAWHTEEVPVAVLARLETIANLGGQS